MNAKLITDILLVFGGMLVGFLFGYMVRCGKERRAERMFAEFEAPAPVDLGYDVNNPINGKRDLKHGDTVEAGGAVWKIM